MLRAIFSCNRRATVLNDVLEPQANNAQPDRTPPQNMIIAAASILTTGATQQLQRPISAEPGVVAESLYKPGQEISTREIVDLLLSMPKFKTVAVEDRMHLLGEASLRLSALDSSLTAERKDLASGIAYQLPQDEAVFYIDGYKQRNFFAGLALDLLAARSLNTDNYTIRLSRVQKLIRIWLKSVPAQSTFNIQGNEYSRDEMRAFRDNPSSFLQACEALESLKQLRKDIHNVELGRASRQQNVHDNSVELKNNLMLKQMVLVLGNKQLSKASFPSDISSISTTNSVDLENAARGLQTVKSLGCRDQFTAGDPRTPYELLGVLWHYIESREDRVLQTNLKNALHERLAEIETERPCFHGKCMRILDVPTGIDDNLDVLGTSQQINEDLTKLAIEAFEEVTAMTENLGMEGNLDTTQASEIAKEIYRSKITKYYPNLTPGEFPEIDKKIEQMELGFNEDAW